MNFTININGVLFDEEQEIRTQVASLLMEDNHLDAVVADILEAANGNQPSEFINSGPRENQVCAPALPLSQ